MELWKGGGESVQCVYHHLYLLFCQKRLHEVLQVCSVLLGSNQLTPAERVLDGHASISSYLDYGEGERSLTALKPFAIIGDRTDFSFLALKQYKLCAQLQQQHTDGVLQSLLQAGVIPRGMPKRLLYCPFSFFFRRNDQLQRSNGNFTLLLIK